jgi:ubiquinone/menaquinone biosynthesis C-methylase UbiE
MGEAFIDWLNLPRNSSWLDVGCGTGALTETIVTVADPSRVVGIDPSNAFIEHARTRVSDPRATFEAGDAQSLPSDLESFDVVVSGLVLNFIPDKAEALRQMSGAVRPGGTIAAYVWDYAEGMQLMRHFWDAAATLDPDSRRFDEGSKDSVCNPQALTQLFSGELSKVEVTPLLVPTIFQDFDDYWLPFLGGVGSAPAYVASLDDESKARLRHVLEERLSFTPAGTIQMTARAWAVKGTRPLS